MNIISFTFNKSLSVDCGVLGLNIIQLAYMASYFTLFLWGKDTSRNVSIYYFF